MSPADAINAAEPVQAWILPAIMGAQALMGFLGARSDRKAHEKTQTATQDENRASREWAAAQNAADRQMYMDYLDRTMGDRRDQLAGLNPLVNSMHGIEGIDLGQYPGAFGSMMPPPPNMRGASPAVAPVQPAMGMGQPAGGGYGVASEMMAALLPMLLAGQGRGRKPRLPSSPTMPTNMLGSGPTVPAGGRRM